MLSERRNHIPFNLSEVCVFHVFYFLAGANFMIIAPYCFYVQRCRTSYLNPRSLIWKRFRYQQQAKIFQVVMYVNV
ncbi:hypothetical protein DYL72_18825 [Vibrio anguillarum]|uniref:DUF3265 domain-containing protein n=1 Tax=Vibrio anguillarum TaxID=55601 RepID=A0A7U5ND19_VIBAN|nr:hypothetical protein CK207_17390 [Vibrio anguillarum]AZS26992.1 hypothetical protein DYL72_18825 [Vibrio anguillarum]